MVTTLAMPEVNDYEFQKLEQKLLEQINSTM